MCSVKYFVTLMTGIWLSLTCLNKTGYNLLSHDKYSPVSRGKGGQGILWEKMAEEGGREVLFPDKDIQEEEKEV